MRDIIKDIINDGEMYLTDKEWGKMKSRKMLGILLGMLMVVPSASVMAGTKINMTINHQNVSFKDARPFIDSNNRTLVPLRFMSEELGASVTWDQKTKTVTIALDETKAVLTIGKTTMVVNGAEVKMDTAPIIKDGVIYVPVKYIGSALGVKTEWDGATSTVAITEVLKDDAVIATIGDSTLTAGEIRNQLIYELIMIQYQYEYGEDFLQSEEAKHYYNTRKAVLIDTFIKNKIALVKAEEYGVMATDEEVETRYKEIQQEYADELEFEELLFSNGYTEASYKNQIRDNLSINNVITYVLERIEVSQSDMKAYYDANITNYQREAGAEMAHILVATKEEALEVEKQYQAGNSFEELALKYGLDGTKDHGGALGYIPYESINYDQDFLNGAKILKEGEVSSPVETRYGWHLIKVTNIHKEGYTIPLSEVEDEIKDAIISSKATEEVNAYMEKWQQEVTVKVNEDLIDAI